MSKLYKYKFIPQNHIVENTLLGVIIINPNILKFIKKNTKKEYFFLEVNQIIYINLIETNQSNSNSLINLIYQLYKKKLLSKIGGLHKIIQIIKQGQIFISSLKTLEDVKILINLLHENYVKRLIIQCGYNIIHLGHLNHFKSQHIYIKVLSQIYHIETEMNQTRINRIVNIKDLISQKLIEIKYHNLLSKLTTDQKALKSGFRDVDKIISNLPQGNLIIIAGRPSIGKTSLAVNIAYNVFFKYQSSLLIFSLEMSNNELFNKIISIASRTIINKKTIKELQYQQWQYISNICNLLLDNNIYINDKSSIDIRYINEISKNIKIKYKQINLIIIDYLQLIEISLNKEKTYNRSQELGYITRKLKLLAQFLQIPIITISQLNRNIETRSNKEPILSDLKESGCIKFEKNIGTASKYAKDLSVSNIKNQKEIIIKIFNNQKKRKLKQLQNTYKFISGYIYLSHEYIFKYITRIRHIMLTHHHKYLSQNTWLESNKILLSTTINYINKHQQKFVYKEYIYDIHLKNYSKSYDINQNKCFNIISDNIITHNSIEQDADIILTLYEKEDKTTYNKTNEYRNIDIKISKNRNGSTGYCKLVFLPAISLFENIQKELI